jgi:hypothetical protein
MFNAELVEQQTGTLHIAGRLTNDRHLCARAPQLSSKIAPSPLHRVHGRHPLTGRDDELHIPGGSGNTSGKSEKLSGDC